MSMKLIFAIVNKDDSGSVSSALTRAGFSVTKLATTGGFLMAVAVSFLVSGYGGLYAKQKFAFSKSASPEGLAHTDRQEHDEPR